MVASTRTAVAGCGLVALGVFVAVTLLVTHVGGTVPAFDQNWHDVLHRFGAENPAWLATMRAITHVGDTATILVVDIALIVLCLWRHRPWLATFVAVVGFGGWGLRILIRDRIDRPRPVDTFWTADGASFPSGHTTNATLMLALVLLVVWPLIRPGGRWALAVVALLAAFGVGVSRVAGGVHWPTDVLGGWSLALAWLCFVATVLPRDRTTPHPPLEPARHGGAAPPDRPEGANG